MKANRSIVWFRQDLRLSDNPALAKACHLGEILPIYILDDCAPSPFKIGGASKLWLYNSLEKLNQSVNGNLNIYIGETSEVMRKLIDQHNINHVFCNVCYEPWHQEQEKKIKDICNQKYINYESCNSNYLWEPNAILKDDKSFYKVFTAYKKKSFFSTPRNPIKTPNKIIMLKDKMNTQTISDLDLLPKNQTWHEKIIKSWDVGELAAKNKLNYFIKNKLSEYEYGRNYPTMNQTSLMSPHLHFGEISPSQIWKEVSAIINSENVEHFLSELTWREFACYSLYHYKTLHINNCKTKFDKLPWGNNLEYLKAWQEGRTGYPLIDAGMRQLWHTGYMHNRVRMVSASFLVKNLNIHWHKGRDWFWDCLFDADLANNSAGWQWVAGCGVDAAPYFRIFNPITQGEKFDKNGDYTRKFVPELKNLPDKYLFKPWEASENTLKSAGVILGKTYPNPIVDLKTSRQKALEAYKKLSSNLYGNSNF